MIDFCPHRAECDSRSGCNKDCLSPERMAAKEKWFPYFVKMVEGWHEDKGSRDSLRLLNVTFGVGVIMNLFASSFEQGWHARDKQGD